PGEPRPPAASHAHATHRCTSSVPASLLFLPGFDISIKPGAGQCVNDAGNVWWHSDCCTGVKGWIWNDYTEVAEWN
ncbi:hypothetical protein ACFOX0_33895, partial [Micromonospora zhanjiangensis]